MKILWIDTAKTELQPYVETLLDADIEIELMTNILDLKPLVEDRESFDHDVIITDVMMPDEGIFDNVETRGGTETGKAIARYINRLRPDKKIIGCSISKDPQIKNWFEDTLEGFIDKGKIRPDSSFVKKLKNKLDKNRKLKPFIVHGHDNELLYELKDFITSKLDLAPATVLREQPSQGKTIIEKFEEYADDIDLVFVLLTPDDDGNNKDNKRRARQNVIFELGYFYSKFSRKSGRVILLYKGKLELPSDISGVIYIKIDSTVESIGIKLKDEVAAIKSKI